ncbi:MAG TPA: tyrosine-type recombinase/integrase [Micromonospora sp.]
MTKGSIKRYCSCIDLATGKQYGTRCPALASDSKHGAWEYRDRFAVSGQDEPKNFRRRGLKTKRAANEFRDQVYEILALAKGDRTALAKLGDLVFASTGRGGQLPELADVRRRLGLGVALDRSQTLGEWLTTWIAGKRKLRDSTADSYLGHIDHFLIPLLGHIPLDRLTELHIHDMFDLIEEWNAEVAAAKAEGRKPVCAGDVRERSRHVGTSTQRRIFATLRNALNAAWKTRRVDTNVCHFVELPPETREPARVWSPEQVAEFLHLTADDRLHLLWRLVLLRGLRRGEVIGLRWADVDLAHRELRVVRPILQIAGKVVTSQPKTKAGERVVSLDKETVTLLKAHRREQVKERLAWADAYEDNDLVFAKEDGSLVRPDYVSRRFRTLAERFGLPVITLHMGRHTAATLALEAGIDVKVVSEQMGHATTTITRDLYQHVRRAVQDGAAEAVVALLPERKRTEVAQ